jgi:two-component system response regulator FixJ
MSGPEPIVYVVEDDDISRRLIIALADSIGLVSRPCADAGEFLDHFDIDQRGCLVLDVFMPGMSGLQLQSELNRRGAIIPVIFVTGNAQMPDVVAAMREGAFNYMLKPFANSELLTNIRLALALDKHNRQVLAHFDQIRARILSLTQREREVLDLLAKGCPNKVMAHEMRVSERTVELHRARVMEKMAAGSLAQLMRMVIDFEHRTRAARHQGVGN